MASNVTPFRDVLAYAIGGGWGQAEPTTAETKKVCVIRGTDIPGARLGKVSDIPVRYESESKAQKRFLQAGDIVLEVSGGNTAKGQYTGRTLLIDQTLLDALEAPAIPASFCRLVRVNPAKVDPTFAYYWLQEMYASGRVALYENQSVGISNFQFERFLDAEAKVLPSLREQRAIAATLASLDQRISNLRATNETLEAIVQALFKSWFVDFDPVKAKAAGQAPAGMDTETAALFPSEFEESEPELLPKGWHRGTLGLVASAIRDGVHVKDLRPDISYLGMEHMPRQSIALNEWGFADEVQSNKSRFAVGDILFGKIRPYFHKVGIAAIDGVCSTDIAVVRPCSPEWYAFCLGHLSSTALIDYASQLSNGAKMPRISWGDLANYPVSLPPSDVAHAFQEAVAPLLQSILANIHESRALIEVRDALLPKLISGELRLPEFGDD